MQKRLKVGLAEIFKPIENYLKRVDDKIKETLKTGIPVLDKSAFHLFEGGGKKIRASLVILSSGLKDAPPDDIIDIAAAAEIIHCASLVHDDIIDESAMRRGLPTVSRLWGSRVAVLAGDFMYTSALAIAGEKINRHLFPILVSATSDMVKGELYQIEYSQIDKVNKEHYFNIIDLKTARFMAACMKLGSVKGRMNEEENEILYNAGLNLGFAFQIVDDTLDVIDSNETGKMSGNDFFEGKITLPFLYLLEKADAGESEMLVNYFKHPSPENWEIVKNRIKETGAVAYCRSVADVYNKKAVEYLKLLPDSMNKDIILDLSRFLVERNF